MQTLASSLQNIPDNFARMLVQVQNYTRRNILPFMQTGRLTDLIWIRPKPNSTIVVDKKKINNGTMQGQNFSFTWSVSRDFTSTEKVGIDVSTTTTSEAPSTTIRAVSTGSPATTSTTEVYSTPFTTSDTVLTDLDTTAIPIMSSPEEVLTTVKSLPDDYFWPGTSTSTEKTTREKLETSTQHHIQRIPKRGEKSLITIPQPFTIVINPDDLTTSSPKPVTTTTPVPKKFESYVQKIPPKKSKEKPLVYTVIRKHPWVRDFKIGEKVVTVENQFGGHMRYRINPDGRYEVW